MPPLAPETPQPGDPAPSTPADDVLLAFLRRRHAGEALPAAAGAHFHDADIYAADPATLTAGYQPAPTAKGEGGSWWFFTHVRPKSRSDTRKSRMVGGGAGTWHSERAPRAVLDGVGNCVGHSQYFSFKRKTGKNCSERTDWYMLEFSEGQGGDHDRVHGGEPVLVLCNIYKAHYGSRSSSSSRSACKRKHTDEHVDQSSAPVKAKRRLFDSPAPTPAATSQEQVSSSFTMTTSPLYSQGEATESEPEAYQGNISGTLDDLRFLPRPEASQGITDIDSMLYYLKSSQEPQTSQNKPGTTPLSFLEAEPEASQSKIGDTSDFLRFWPRPEASQSRTDIDSMLDSLKSSQEPKTLQNKTSATPLSFLLAEPEASQSKIGDTSDFLRFWPRPEASQGRTDIDSMLDYLKSSQEPKTSQNKTSTTPRSFLVAEPESSQSKIGDTSDFLRFWPRPEASQGRTDIDSMLDYLKSSQEPKTSQNKTSTTPRSFLVAEPEASQSKIGDTSDFLRFWPEREASEGKIDGTEALQNKSSNTSPSQLMLEPEVPAPQVEMATDWGIQMATGSDPSVLGDCYGMTDLMNNGYRSGFALGGQDSVSWRGNYIDVSSSCPNLGSFAGAPSIYNQWSTVGFASGPNACRMPFTTLMLPPVSSSSWCTDPALWSY